MNFFKNNVFCSFVKIKKSIGAIRSWCNMLFVRSLDKIVFCRVTNFISAFGCHEDKFKIFFRSGQKSVYIQVFQLYWRWDRWWILNQNGIKSIIISWQSNIQIPLFDCKISSKNSLNDFFIFGCLSFSSKAYLQMTFNTFLNYHLYCSINTINYIRVILSVLKNVGMFPVQG